MASLNRGPFRWSLLVGAVFVVFLVSCGEKAPEIKKTAENSRLAGLWVLKAKLAESGEPTAIDRQMRLSLGSDQLFVAEFRANDSQNWIRGGAGSFAYNPPLLTLYWESGQVNGLLIQEKDPETIVVHHCRTMIPVKDQEPSEIFIRQKGGPTRKSS